VINKGKKMTEIAFIRVICEGLIGLLNDFLLFLAYFLVIFYLERFSSFLLIAEVVMPSALEEKLKQKP
jgi:hypothetical protein